MRMMYSPREVRDLIEGYAELRETKATSGWGLYNLCRLADIDRAISKLLPKEHHAVLLHGQLRKTEREAAASLGVGRTTLQRQYSSGIEWIVNYLNTGEE